MKRAIFTFLVLLVGVGLGGGGLYVGTHWDKFNPLRKPDSQESLQRFRAELQKACASEPALKGSFIKSVDVAGGKLTLKGFVASKEQTALLEAKGKSLLEESEEVRTQCTGGVSTEDLKVLPIHEQLAVLQRDFDQGRGAEKDDDQDAHKRQVMRATRLDGVSFTEDGKLVFTGVCIHGNGKPEITSHLIREAISSRLEALGLQATIIPTIALDMRFVASPALTLQKQLENNAGAKDVVLTAARYDDKGGLHLEGIVGDDAERKAVDAAVAAFVKDAQTAPIAKGPGAAGNVTQHLVTFQGEKHVLELQKKLVEYARKENKPHLRRVRLDKVLPTALEDDKKKIRTDDEGNILYYFRVTGRLYRTADDAAQIEKELNGWLIKELPKVPNPDQKPMPPKFALDVQDSPIFAMQERIVQRGLDGAVFTDALFDEKGDLEILGRWHQAEAKSREALEAAVKSVLVNESAWSLQSLKPHESNPGGQAIAWKDVVSGCQAKLAEESTLGQRVRIDRLYFNYEAQQLQLRADGVFVVDGPKESPDGALRKAIDDVIATRGQAFIKTSGLKQVKNPVGELQNLTTSQASLDGVLVTGMRYGADGTLILDGRLGAAGHKAALAPIVAQRLEQTPELLKKGSDPKTAPGWAMDAMKPYQSAKGDSTWSAIVRAVQGELASAPEPMFRRACLGRAYFQYAEEAGKPRRLILQCGATFLAAPQDGGADAFFKQQLEQKLAAVGKQRLPDVAIDQVRADMSRFDSPILDLQRQAVAKGYDGLLFQNAFFDGDGKLTFDGMRGAPEQLKQAKELIEQFLADKANKGIAPAGLAPLDGIKLVAWQPMLDEVKSQFAKDKAALYKQTRIDRAYFQYDKSGTKALLHFKGICIYEGKVLSPEERHAKIADKLKKHLPGKGIDGFDIDVGDIAPAANPIYEMQTKARDLKFDGVVFGEIGFDAKGVCYVKLPFAPKGQADNIRKLIDESSKKHKHLGPIVEQN